ncbi:MAG: hypothetical protein NC400_04855 [Clostridium sp.]|nr:hypothetical protein [Clostridium sp.]
MSMLRYGQYGQVDVDGIWRNKEKVNEKSGDKKTTKKTQMQYDKILTFMEEGKEYGIWNLGFLRVVGFEGKPHKRYFERSFRLY